MSSNESQCLYEARIRIEDVIIFKVAGNDTNGLKVLLSAKCELEKSGAEGEIIEISTGEIIYRCRKQTTIDE
ncbi:hypothetical protein EP47_04750 [Legionella norrlandica]|uniref:Uncharacterized protein n=1 Tax=Legionella norrlandica TaxID=1498499 RepID=A0A0A2T8C3_9GAMM|nr:hypothetical protein [Legionella norrlandica]KGP63678.1 hypothetical protein EP47_04750 [Legionella norrlandica]